jgi:hypothetical protein
VRACFALQTGMSARSDLIKPKHFCHTKNIKNNSIQFFIIYVPNQQLQGQLQTQHRVDTSNYIMDEHNLKSKTNYRQALEENILMQKSKQTNKQKTK